MTDEPNDLDLDRRLRTLAPTVDVERALASANRARAADRRARTLTLGTLAVVAVLAVGSVVVTRGPEDQSLTTEWGDASTSMTTTSTVPPTVTTTAPSPQTVTIGPPPTVAVVPVPPITAPTSVPTTVTTAPTSEPARLPFEPFTVSVDGVRPITVGMSMEDFSSATGIEVFATPEGVCAVGNHSFSEQPEGLFVNFDADDRVHSILLSSSAWGTPEGFTVGTPIADVEAAYPGLEPVQIGHPYAALAAWSPDRTRALVFVHDQGAVTNFFVTRTPSAATCPQG